jgi:hypothetical protein
MDIPLLWHCCLLPCRWPHYGDTTFLGHYLSLGQMQPLCGTIVSNSGDAAMTRHNDIHSTLSDYDESGVKLVDIALSKALSLCFSMSTKATVAFDRYMYSEKIL